MIKQNGKGLVSNGARTRHLQALENGGREIHDKVFGGRGKSLRFSKWPPLSKMAAAQELAESLGAEDLYSYFGIDRTSNDKEVSKCA